MPPLIPSGPTDSSTRKGLATTMGSAALGDAIRNIRDWSMTEGRQARMPARVSDLFGSLVFNDRCSRLGCPRPSTRRSATRSPRAPRSSRPPPTPWPSALKDWAIEHGASHFTHWFQPMTGITAEKHDSFFAPGERRPLDGRVQRQGTGQGRARRVELPVGRHAQHLRGARLHGVGSRPARRGCCATATASRWSSRRRSSAGPARRSTRRRRCSARWRRCPRRRCAR